MESHRIPLGPVLSPSVLLSRHMSPLPGKYPD